MRLTDAYLRKLTTDTRIEIADDTCRGLKLRAGKDGSRIWTLVVWNSAAKKAVRHSLGEFPDMNCAAARRAADAVREKLATDERVDPETVLTFNALADSYIELYAKRSKKSWQQDVLFLRRPRDAWGGRAAASITRRDIVALLDTIAILAPVSSNRTRSVLSKMLVWATDRELLSVNPIAGWREKPGGKETSKERVLTDDEVRTWWRTSGRSMAHAVCRGILLTAQRPGEVAGMMIEELDMQAAVWHLPGSKVKNGKPHSVPLGRWALAYLKPIIGERTEGPVFQGRGGGAMTRHAVTRRCEVEGVASFTPHDLRRTAATAARRHGAAVSDIAALLNHTEKGVTASVYALSDRMPEKLRAVAALEKWLDSIL